MTNGHSRYNWIYKKLTNDPNDMVGALAYVIYKRQKIAYIEAYAIEHGGTEPDDAALKSFHISTDNEIAIAGFRTQAEVMLDKFLDQLLAGQLEQMLEEVKESTFITKSNSVEENVRTDIEHSKQLIQGEISKVQTTLSERKGFWGWIGALGGSLLVNLLTVIVIGLAVVGFNQLATIKTFLKQTIENSANPAPSNTDESTKPTKP